MRWSGRWRKLAPAAVVLLVAGSVTASALTAPGYRQRRVTLDDGGIWTAQATSTDPSNPGSSVGRANPAAGVIDTAVVATAYPQLLQDGAHVVFHDAGSGSVTSVNTVLGTTSKPLMAPPLTAPPGTLAVGATANADNAGDPRVDLNAAGEVGLGDDTVAVVDQAAGKLYLFPADALPSGPLGASQAVARVARSSKVVVDTTGVTHVVSPGGVVDDYSPTGQRLRHSSLGADLAKASSPGSPWSVSAVGGVAVVLDGSGQVYAEGSSGPVATVTGGVLQQPGPARPGVLLETASSLVSVALHGGAVRTLAGTGSGAATAPVYVAARGCAYAAWDGSAGVPADASSNGTPPRPPTIAVRCDDGTSYDGRGEASPVWRVNRGSALLNDQVTGANLFLDGLQPQTIADWSQAQRPGLSSTAVAASTQTVANTNTPALPSAVEHAPTAVADSAATRPGLPVIVPVLANDTDPDGDLLAVTAVTQPAGGAVATIVDGGGAVQVTPSGDSPAPIEFTYTIDDGRQGTSTAPVTVSIHPESQNSPPSVTPSPTPVAVAAGGRVTVDLLQGVTDPDGDAVTVASAGLPAGDGSVSLTGAGLAVVSPAKAGQVTLSFTVTDGHGATAPGGLQLAVSAAGSEVAPQAHDDRLGMPVGTATVDVLSNDSDAGDVPLRIASVTAPPGLSVTMPADGAGGVLTVTAPNPGESLVRYTVTDGTATSTATLRVDATAADAPATRPVTAVRDDATLRPGVPTTIPVLANDLDSAGGVLVVDGLAGIPAGLVVTQSGHATLTVSSAAPLSRSESFNYTASDGVNAATGTVVVSPAPIGVDQPPVTGPSTGTVRAGNALPLDVLADDFDPEGEALTLASVTPLPPAEGLVFVEADQLRYVAPAGPVGAVTIDYTVTDSAGNASSGEATVHVVGRDAPNHPPQPNAVTARVFTGASITVALPLEGIDPDGDVTTLVSVAPAAAPGPALGSVAAPLGLDHFTFTAGGVGGTERLSYQVRDSGGLTATGTVSIGVVDPPQTDTAPVALPDTVSLAPGATRTVPVLANDSDADGDPLSLDPGALTAPSAGSVGISGTGLVVTAPTGVRDGTTLSVGYGITDGRGGRASSTLTETVTSHPPAAPPIAVDDLTAPQVAGSTVSVPVLANDQVSNGTAATAKVTAAAGAPAGVAVLPGGTLQFPMPNRAVSFGYTVTDSSGLSASALVRVPLAAGASPIANPDTATTAAGAAVEVNLTANDTDAGGRRLSLAGVSAGVGGTATVTSSTSARFTPTVGFAGLASFGYTVSDGGASAAGLVTVTVTQVNRKPSVTPLTSTLTAGHSVTLDLRRAVSDPDPGDSLAFTGVTGAGGRTGVTARLAGSDLVVAAAAGAPATKLTLHYSVDDGHGGTTAGTVALTVAGSRRPASAKPGAPTPSATPSAALPQAVPDAVSTLAGHVVSVPVLANDVDPLGRGLHLVSVGDVGSAGTASVVGDDLVFRPAETFHGVATISYVLADASGDPARQATGSLRVTVVGRPDAPGVPRGQGGNGQVILHWTTPEANGGRISGYTVHYGVSVRQCASTTCTIKGLPNGHAYVFTVTATDQAGTSPASGPSAGVTVDVAPSAPGAPIGVGGNRTVALTWTPPASSGSGITGYTVTVSPGGLAVAATTTSATVTGLTDGTAYTFTVTASNKAGTSPPSAPSAPVVPSAGPATPAPPVVTVSTAGTTLVLTWVSPDPMGSPITSYTFHEYVDGAYAKAITVKSSPLTLSVAATKGHTYAFRLAATNALGHSAYSAASKTVLAAARPAVVGTVKATAGDGKATLDWTAPAANGGPITRYVVTPSSGAARAFTTSSASFTGLTNGKAYTFRVSACNSVGCGPASAASAAVTPAKPKAKK